MSRSRKKTPVFGNTTSESEKGDKRLANRRLRRENRMRIEKGDELAELREVSDVWSFSKDGKKYLKNRDSLEFLRK